MDIDEACRHLKITLAAIDESTINLVFDSARLDNPGAKTDLAIAAVLKAYQRPKVVPAHSPNSWPVGLTSHGNTCYLNSLLQYYFTIKPLRDIVLNFEDYKFDLATHKGKAERVGARRVKPFEIEAYQKFVSDLRNLFERMIKDPGTAVKPEADLVCRAFLKASETEDGQSVLNGAVGIPEQGNADGEQSEDIVMSGESREEAPSIDQPQGTYHATPEMSQASEGITSTKPRQDSMASSVTLPVGGDEQIPDTMTDPSMFPPSPPSSRPSSISEIKPEPSYAPPLPPRIVTTPERQHSNLEKAEEAARQQQDVTEVMDEILFRLRCAIKPLGMDKREEQMDQFRDIFYLRVAEMTYSGNEKPTAVIEDVSNILLNIPSEPTDIYSALDEIFDLQTIERAGSHVSQYKALQSLPPVLQINIPRNTYNRATGRGVKVEHRIHLDDVIYLDRYLDNASPDLLEKRKQCWDWRKRLQSLQAEKEIFSKSTVNLGIDGSTALEATKEFLQGLRSANDDLESLGSDPIDLDESLMQDIAEEAEYQRHQLSAIDSRIADLRTQIGAQFQGLEKEKYRLYAVFFHRGGYGHGHYWTYIHDLKSDIWRIYNDEKVDEFTKLDDIYNAETWQQGTPTYAVYVRDDMKEEYVEPVCRDPEEPPQALPVEEAASEPVLEPIAEPVDEVMQDDAPAETAARSEWDSSYAPPSNIKW